MSQISGKQPFRLGEIKAQRGQANFLRSHSRCLHWTPKPVSGSSHCQAVPALLPSSRACSPTVRARESQVSLDRTGESRISTRSLGFAPCPEEVHTSESKRLGMGPAASASDSGEG